MPASISGASNCSSCRPAAREPIEGIALRISANMLASSTRAGRGVELVAAIVLHVSSSRAAGSAAVAL